MVKIKSLVNTNFDSIFFAFNEAFKDYEMQLNKEELNVMLNRRGFNPAISFAAFEDDRIIAFTLNGIGVYKDVKTAYDTGTGTIKEFRGQGLATQIFNHSIPHLKEAGISQYLLEVLQHNSKAVSVYKKLGFKVSREFNFFVQKMDEVNLDSKVLESDYHLRQIDLTDKQTMMAFWDFIPSWQNSFDAIFRKPDDFKITGILTEGKLIGYTIFETNSGDLTQIAVDRKYRRKGIATALLKEILQSNQHHSVKVINTELECTSITGFLQSHSIFVSGKQFEMIKEL